MSSYSDTYQSETARSGGGRSGRGADNDTYDPDQYSMRNTAARDGYAPGDGYANPDGRASQQTATYSGSAYEEEGPGLQQQRYLEYDRRSDRRYDDTRSRSHDDLDRSRYYDDGGDDDDDEYYNQRRVERRRHKSHDRYRDRSRSKSRGSRPAGNDEDEDGNTELKKWGATLAGAAIGAYGGHRAKRDNWVPAAIGAVVGGLVAREAEKAVVKARHDKKEERWMEEEEYRSRSR